jgi:hypothetical protein
MKKLITISAIVSLLATTVVIADDAPATATQNPSITSSQKQMLMNKMQQMRQNKQEMEQQHPGQ